MSGWLVVGTVQVQVQGGEVRGSALFLFGGLPLLDHCFLWKNPYMYHIVNTIRSTLPMLAQCL